MFSITKNCWKHSHWNAKLRIDVNAHHHHLPSACTEPLPLLYLLSAALCKNFLLFKKLTSSQNCRWKGNRNNTCKYVDWLFFLLNMVSCVKAETQAKVILKQDPEANIWQNMLKRREKCNTSLICVCRHHFNRENPVKR